MRDEGRWQGQEVLDGTLLRECTTPSAANPNYGLTFWLSTAAMADLVPAAARARARRASAAGARGVVMAAGAGVQRLYTLRDENLVVVRLGRTDPSWSDTEFVTLLTRGAREE